MLLIATAATGASAQSLYYAVDTQRQANRFSIFRSDLDGQNRTEVARDLHGLPYYTRLEVFGDRIYWITFEGQTLAATLDGTFLGPTDPPNADVAARLRDRPRNAAGTHTYFPGADETGLRQFILRGDGEEGNATEFIPTRQFSPDPTIALDETNGHIYWAGAWSGGETGAVQRANLADGSDVRTLVEGFAMDDYFVDLVLDVERGKMYWATRASSRSSTPTSTARTSKT